jgi:hypothetical protein
MAYWTNYRLSDPNVATKGIARQHASGYTGPIMVGGCSGILLPWFVFVFLGTVGLVSETSIIPLLPFCSICGIIFFFIWSYFNRQEQNRWFRDASNEWFLWLEKAQLAKLESELPKFVNSSQCNKCLVAFFPKEGKTAEYEFDNPSDAELFCNRHRKVILERLRKAYIGETGERGLALGQMDYEQDCPLLIFRQLSDECALFFTVRHCRTGTVVNLITHKWFVFNRKISNENNREKSDLDVANSSGDLMDKIAAWGCLGVWHYVHACAYGNGRSDTSKPNSELNYFEKIVHIDTVKDAYMRPETPPQPVVAPGHKDPAKTDQPQWL